MPVSDPTTSLVPGQPYIVDGLDWSWAYVVFRDVEGAPGYCVGSNSTAWSRRVHGRVAGLWRQLKTPGSDRGWYPKLQLRIDNRSVGYYLHDLVLRAFRGPRLAGMEGCHRDGNKGNCDLRNLYWGTPKDNGADRRRHGRLIVGSNHRFAILTEDKVREIRILYANGSNRATIGKRFGISPAAVSSITSRRSWKHVP